MIVTSKQQKKEDVMTAIYVGLCTAQ